MERCEHGTALVNECPKCYGGDIVSESPSVTGLSCADKAVEQLIELAAEMGMRNGMPSEYVEDWPISKHTPQKTLNEIERNMEIIQKKIADWCYAVRQIANELHKAR
jgi:predicted DNA-binding helix-hairpin-helix protein